MNILVVGAGTVGSVVGGYLTGNGCNVTLADGWMKNVDVLNKEGLKLSGTRGEHHFRLKAITLDELAKQTNSYDIIYISVKNYDTAAVVELIRPLVLQDTVVISTQNGINEEYIADAIGVKHVIGAVTEFSGYMLGPGSVVETRKDGGFVLGELDGKDTPRLRKIADIMAACGNVKISNNIMGILWSKLIWNSMMNPLTAISGFGTGRILQNDQYRKIAIEVGKEGFKVSNKHQVTLEPLTLMGIDPRRLDPNKLEEINAEEAALKLLPEPLDKMPSMAQDIKNGRPTEIDYINGIIVEWGKRYNIQTPVNEEVVKSLHDVETKRQAQSPALLDEMVKKFAI